MTCPQIPSPLQEGKGGAHDESIHKRQGLGGEGRGGRGGGLRRWREGDDQTNLSLMVFPRPFLVIRKNLVIFALPLGNTDILENGHVTNCKTKQAGDEFQSCIQCIQSFGNYTL